MTMTPLQHHLLALAVTSAVTLGFGLFVLRKDPRRSLNRSMALYCLSLAWWSGWECAALQMSSREMAHLFMRIEYVGVVFIPTLMCTVIAHLLNFSSRSRKHFLLPLYALSILAMLPTAIFPVRDFLWISPGPVAYLPIWGHAGPFYWIFLTLWFSVVVLGHSIVFVGWMHSKGQERARLSLFLVGTLFAYLGGCPEFALKYGIRMGFLNPFGLYAFPVYIGVLTYAVVQHHFLDIQVVIRKSLVYSLLVSLLTVGYFGLVYLAERLFQNQIGYQSTGISLVAFAGMALLFQPLKNGLQAAVDRWLLPEPKEVLLRRMENLEREVAEVDKAKAVNMLAAGISHEIKNPLTAIRTFMDYLSDRHADPGFIEQFQKIVGKELDRLQQLSQGLVDFSKPSLSQRVLVNLIEVLGRATALTGPDLTKKGISVVTAYQHNGSQIIGDEGQLLQAILNLMLNARDAMPKGGRLTVETSTVGDAVEISVADTGHGISANNIAKILDPFFTNKKNGTGLGLSITRRIIEDHGGTIRVSSQVGQGTTFTIKLPVQPAEVVV